jgi:hypothetical protein
MLWHTLGGMQTTEAYPMPVDPRIVPQPPRLHWGWVLALSWLTLGVFGTVWLVVQALWAKRLTGNSKPLVIAIVLACTTPFFFVLMICVGFVMGATGHSADVKPLSNLLVSVFKLLIVGLHLATVFMLRSELEDSPINISLSGVMTLFFGTTYFQYHLMDYSVPTAEEVYGAIPAAPAYVPSTSLEPSL